MIGIGQHRAAQVRNLATDEEAGFAGDQQRGYGKSPLRDLDRGLRIQALAARAGSGDQHGAPPGLDDVDPASYRQAVRHRELQRRVRRAAHGRSAIGFPDGARLRHALHRRGARLQHAVDVNPVIRAVPFWIVLP